MIKRTQKLKNADSAPVRQTELKSIKPEAPAAISRPQAAEPVKTAPTPLPVAAAPAPMKTQAARPAHVALEFVKPEAKTVCVAGSFNGWKPDSTPLAKTGAGKWVADLAVGPGRYEYLFVVDGQWLPDPNAKESVQNPYGGKNSVLSV